MDARSFVKVLDDDLRWDLIATLSETDARLRELVFQLKQPSERIRAALEPLLEQGLVRQHQSDAKRDEVYYQLDLEKTRDAFQALGYALHPALVATEPDETEIRLPVVKPRVLFLCTHNSGRSQMAEGLLRSFGKGAVESFSAGTEPSRVNPLAVETLQRMGVDISEQRSKHLEEFLDQPFDYVVTVCDSAREVCPAFPGAQRQIHWSTQDPSVINGDTPRRKAFQQVASELSTRVRYLLIFLERERRERVRMQHGQLTSLTRERVR